MTTAHEESRTLVKSSPELWAELSDAASLARHLGEFGDIEITKLEPETTVAWEGDRVSGTVQLEPSGWGTKVTLTAKTSPPEPEPPPAHVSQPKSLPEPAPDPDPMPNPDPMPPDPLPPAAGPPPRRGFLSRMRGVLGGRTVPGASAPSVPEPVPAAPEPVPSAPEPRPPEPAAVPRAASAPRPPEPVAAPPAALEPRPPEPVAAPEPPMLDAAAVLTAALDSLGQAHHRPFSRN
jgi:hypothetical protein